MSACVQPEMNQPLCDRLFEASDELLVSAAQGGDAIAFVELVRRHVAKIKSQIFRMVKNKEDADDVFQEAIIRAYLNIRYFEARSRFSTWLTRIAINSALMRLRKKRCIEIPLEIAHDGAERGMFWEPADARDTPEQDLVNREREELVKMAILRLPQKLRIVVQMRQTHECSSKDIAKQLGISVAAVKSRLSRARQLLRVSTAGF